MAAYDDDDFVDDFVDDSFSRPRFLRELKSEANTTPIDLEPDAEEADDDLPLTRAYTLTGGRTVASPQVQFETMVSAGVKPKNLRDHEKRIVAAVQHDALSVAEVAVAVALPIGVVRVLISDLVANSFLVASATVSRIDDASGHIDLLRRVISGVETL